MKNLTFSDFIEERVEENKELFTIEEIACIKSHKECIHKIYLLGLMNAKACYEKDIFCD